MRTGLLTLVMCIFLAGTASAQSVDDDVSAYFAAVAIDERAAMGGDQAIV